MLYGGERCPQCPPEPRRALEQYEPRLKLCRVNRNVGMKGRMAFARSARVRARELPDNSTDNNAANVVDRQHGLADMKVASGAGVFERVPRAIIGGNAPKLFAPWTWRERHDACLPDGQYGSPPLPSAAADKKQAAVDRAHFARIDHRNLSAWQKRRTTVA